MKENEDPDLESTVFYCFVPMIRERDHEEKCQSRPKTPIEFEKRRTNFMGFTTRVSRGP